MMYSREEAESRVLDQKASTSGKKEGNDSNQLITPIRKLNDSQIINNPMAAERKRSSMNIVDCDTPSPRRTLSNSIVGTLRYPVAGGPQTSSNQINQSSSPRVQPLKLS
ncbi:hypothetical protein FGO68_gene12475 [Halteria grandinella]|uniref:Uncharacterized protein n=1 Tax=Halteria grandinella TaxID=5974 RepID=A0A8J8T997_HALGN|nr:hypothetical protein FGO68_gene12475 [Halteria grandinella]